MGKPRVAMRLGVIVVCGIVMFGLLLRWIELSQVYAPTKRWTATPEALPGEWQELSLTTSDGIKLSAWFLRPLKGGPSRDVAVLISHGNGGNISHRFDLYELWLSLGVHVMAYDYRGYGHSEGTPSEVGTYKDSQAAYERLREMGFPPDRIILYGESLGGAVATDLAVKREGAALVLRSTFTSIPEMAASLYPFIPGIRKLPSMEYDSLAKISRVKIPIVIMHSPKDSIVPYAHGKALFDAASEPKRFVEMEGDHNAVMAVDRGRIREAMKALLEEMESQ